MSGNIISLPNKEKEILIAALEDFKRNMDIYIQLQCQTAKLRRAHYLALIDEGFTEQQALLICEKNPLLL